MKNYFLRKRINNSLFSNLTILKTNLKGLFFYFNSFVLEWCELLFLK